ncbi:MAG: cytidine deaminase [Dongiaceae bacterium]
MSPIEEMLAAAKRARAQAYAPYSNFAVGACLRGKSGTLYSGCNVENAAYPQGQCAEATAIGVMVAAGERAIAEVLIVGDGRELISPCGGCRQRLNEFAAPDTPVHLCDPQGVRRSITLGELLPLSFGPRQLGKP